MHPDAPQIPNIYGQWLLPVAASVSEPIYNPLWVKASFKLPIAYFQAYLQCWNDLTGEKGADTVANLVAAQKMAVATLLSQQMTMENLVQLKSWEIFICNLLTTNHNTPFIAYFSPFVLLPVVTLLCFYPLSIPSAPFTSSFPPSFLFPLLFLNLALFLCSSQWGALSNQSQYALSAGLLNSNLKAGSRFATEKLATEVPAPKHTRKVHTDAHTRMQRALSLQQKASRGGFGFACERCIVICLCWQTCESDIWYLNCRGLVVHSFGRFWCVHTHAGTCSSFAELCQSITLRLCICVCARGKWARRRVGKRRVSQL